MKDRDRRTEVRYLTEGNAEMRLTARLFRRERVRVQVCDISNSGIRVCANVKVAEKSKVQLLVGDLLLSAEVRWCKEVKPDVFEVGIKTVQVAGTPKNRTRTRGSVVSA